MKQKFLTITAIVGTLLMSITPVRSSAQSNIHSIDTTWVLPHKIVKTMSTTGISDSLVFSWTDTSYANALFGIKSITFSIRNGYYLDSGIVFYCYYLSGGGIGSIGAIAFERGPQTGQPVQLIPGVGVLNPNLYVYNAYGNLTKGILYFKVYGYSRYNKFKNGFPSGGGSEVGHNIPVTITVAGGNY